jgi:hypothetical protein
MMSVKSASNMMIVTGTSRIHIVHVVAPLSPWTVVQQMRRRGIARAITRSGGGPMRAWVRADKVLRMFKAPGTLDRSWAKAELLTDLALSGGGSE